MRQRLIKRRMAAAGRALIAIHAEHRCLDKGTKHKLIGPLLELEFIFFLTLFHR
jgi:hypothetical protein